MSDSRLYIFCLKSHIQLGLTMEISAFVCMHGGYVLKEHKFNLRSKTPRSKSGKADSFMKIPQYPYGPSISWKLRKTMAANGTGLLSCVCGLLSFEIALGLVSFHVLVVVLPRICHTEPSSNLARDFPSARGLPGSIGFAHKFAAVPPWRNVPKGSATSCFHSSSR